MTRREAIAELSDRLKASNATDLVNRLETLISDECITIDDVPDCDLFAAVIALRKRLPNTI